MVSAKSPKPVKSKNKLYLFDTDTSMIQILPSVSILKPFDCNCQLSVPRSLFVLSVVGWSHNTDWFTLTSTCFKYICHGIQDGCQQPKTHSALQFTRFSYLRYLSHEHYTLGQPKARSGNLGYYLIVRNVTGNMKVFLKKTLSWTLMFYTLNWHPLKSA